MDEDAGFLRAISAAPEDVSLRLIYADWLEERGDPRGEYLRCQCARAGLSPKGRKYAALRRREKQLCEQYPDLIPPWQRRLTLGHIRSLLGRGGSDPISRYTPNPCLTEEEVAAWETAHGVALPEEYRLFLREVGDGGVMPGSYTDFIIEPLAEVWGGPSAATPFPVTADRLRNRLRQRKTAGQPISGGYRFPELVEYWENDEQPPGCLVFGQYPSADALFLVTAGPLRGSVWCRVDSGLPERDPSGELRGFLDWFADVLAELHSPEG